MDRRECKKRPREEEGMGGKREDYVLDFVFEEVAAAAAALDGEAWRRPPGVFEFPWQEGRGGLGVAASGGGWEIWDVFFSSLVDGRAADIGVPGDRLSPPPSKRPLLDDVDAWLAAAGGEDAAAAGDDDDVSVDPIWRSVLKGPTAA